MLKRLIHFKIQDSPNPVWFRRGKRNDYFDNVIKTFMGRDALNILLYNIKKKSVLLPAYVCKEVTTEFIKHGYTIHYYDINNDFSINIDLIKKKLKEERIEVFYYVVYFGVYSKYSSLAQQVKKEIPNTFIIEDRAHYLSNKYDFTNCDAYIFSFRKTLPIAEGGGLATKIKIEFDYKGKVLANVLPVAMFMKKLLLGYSNKITRSSIVKDNISQRIRPISFLSDQIIQKTNYEDENSFRRETYIKWVEKLGSSDIEPLFLEIDAQDIPLGCPIYVNDAAKLQSELEEKGFYLKRHWPLSEDLKTVAPNSVEMSKNIITLPIYKGINERDQDEIITCILNFN
jgi:dTDP-4-amino-4,6-dideoxygalactose transaminase